MSDLDLKKILGDSRGAAEEEKPKKEEASLQEVKKEGTLPVPDAAAGLMGLLSTKEGANEKVIDSYNNVTIVDTGADLPVYRVNIPHLTLADKNVISAVQKIATKIIDVRQLSANPAERKQLLNEKIYEMISKSSSIKVSDNKKEAYADIISREMGGYGLFDYLLDDDQLEEIMVVPPHRITYVFHRKYGMLITNITVSDDVYVDNVIERIARDVARRIDVNTPLLDARLPSGDRVNATIPPASVDGPSLTIRKFREDPYTMISMLDFGTISPEAAAYLWLTVEGMRAYPCNILISGGTGSGKTTFLNSMAMFIRPTERVLTIEDTAELQLPLRHWVRLETRPPSIEGTGEIKMDALLKNSLRMRPDRIIVGEVRHDEAFTLFTAMNTGHQGSMGTIHANSADETLVRLMSPPMNVPEQMATALNLIVILNRMNIPGVGMVRRVTEIAEISGKKIPEARIIYEWDSTKDKLVRVEANSRCLKLISRYSGISEAKLETEIKTRARLLTEAQKKKMVTITPFSTLIHKYYERT